MNWKKFGSELIKRNVVRAVVAYLAVSWVIVQIASTVFPAFGVPAYFLKGLIYLLGIGLIFWTVFAWIYDLTPEGIKRTDSEEVDMEVHESNSRRLNQIIVGAVVCAIVVLVGASFWAGSQWANPDQRTTSVKIAIIPFKTETQAGEDEIWEEGLTEELIEEFSRATDLLVLSMATTRHMEAGMNPNIEVLAASTEEVDYFLLGSVKKTMNQIELTLTLTTEIDGNPIWSDTYRQDIAKVRNLWAQVVTDIREAIGPGVAIDRTRWQGLKPVRPEVYELYLKGKYHLNKSSVEDWQRGLVYLQEAIDRNPADPDAYAGMAEGYITWGHSLMPPTDVFPKAEAAAIRAIQLDSNNAAGWAALSQYHTYFGWDWDLADYAFHRADSLNPNLAMNHYHRAWYHALFGRMDQAIEEHKIAQEIDPFSALHTAWLGGLYNMVGEYDMALEEAEKSSQMFGDLALGKVIAGRAYIGKGAIARGIDTLRAASRINAGWKGLVLAPILVKHGHREEAMNIAADLESRAPTPFFSLCLAQIYYADRNYEAAFQWLDKARGHAFYPWTVRIFLTAPDFRADPRYQEHLAELNLPYPAPLKYRGNNIPLEEIKPY